MNLSLNPQFKFLIVLILIFNFYSCSKEDITQIINNETSKNVQPPFSEFKMLHKTGAFLNGKDKLRNTLDLIRKNNSKHASQTKSGEISSSEFKIFTDNVTYVYSPEDSTETYSFYIERNFKRDNYIIENLIIRKPVGSKNFRAYVVEYFLKNGLSNDKENLKVANFEEINIDSISGLSKECANTYESYVVEIEHDCGSGEHSGAGEAGSCNLSGSSLPYSTYEITVVVNGCGGSAGGGGYGDPSDPGSGEPSGPGGGGGDTGSGGANDGIDTGISLPPSCQTTDCAEEDILANQINEKLNSSLSYEELIWLFDNNFQAQRIDNFLDANRFDLTAKVFANKALQALKEGGEVDFSYRVIVDDSFKENECLNDIYEAMGKAPTFNGFLQAFNSSMSVANLKFGSKNNFGTVYEDYTNAMAITNTPLSSNMINIDFNTDPSTSGNILNKPDVFKVVSLIHEVLHAEMYRKMLDAVKATEITSTNLNWRTWPLGTNFDDFVESLENKYFGIFDHYTRYDWDDDAPDNAQHQQMAGYYRDVVKQALTEYDPSLTLAQKEALSWIGLNSADIVAWQLKTPEEQEAINDLIQNIQNTFPNGCN